MGQPVAKANDQVTAVDVHIILIPSPVGPIPTPLPNPFSGQINGGLSGNVKAMGCFVATVGSIAQNMPPHIPDGGPFMIPPTNQAQIVSGSATVMVNGKPVARSGDTALTCNDPVDLPIGTVSATGTVNAS